MNAPFIVCAILAVCMAGAMPAAARVTTINATAVEPFAAGAAFGTTGAYERVKGTFRGELDPADARNRIIVNLDKAPRNAAGKVEYEADFFILRPAVAARGNGKLIYDVNNRGRKLAHARLMDARPGPVAKSNDPMTAEDVGSGLFLRMGYAFAWSGWDPDAPRANNGMAMKPVIATNGGTPIVRTIRDELVSGTRGPLRETFRLTYEAASLDTRQARLTVRRNEIDPRREIPASGWAYVNAREIRLLPDGTKPEPGSLYELHYPAVNPRVLGIGMAATRDFVSFLRYEVADAAGTANPARTIRAALGFGISQSGRFLRDFVHDGFNQDEASRKVFDGALAHISGVGGVFLNHEFGQPARTNTQHEDHTFPENAFPFSAARMTDSVTGKSGSLLRNDGFDPLWIETNTSTEYWQKGASLLTTDPLGEKDIALPPNARIYLIAGTQHGGAAWLRSAPGHCANPSNPHSPTPALRALMIALDEWVTRGRLPPPSRTPRLADGTLVPAQQLQFPSIPAMQAVHRVNEIGILRDWVKPVIDMTKPYRTLVARVDADGNETSGIRLPDIDVPLGTYTGWNVYRSPYPEGELCDRTGSYVPFAPTRAERLASGDPRPSLAERYGDHAGYVRRVEEAVQRLLSEQLLLAEDAEHFIAKAKSSDIAQRFIGSH